MSMPYWIKNRIETPIHVKESESSSECAHPGTVDDDKKTNVESERRMVVNASTDQATSQEDCELGKMETQDKQLTKEDSHTQENICEIHSCDVVKPDIWANLIMPTATHENCHRSIMQEQDNQKARETGKGKPCKKAGQKKAAKAKSKR